MKVSVVLTKDGKEVVRPIGDFMREANTKEKMPTSIFVFAGSKFLQNLDPDKKTPVYLCDLTGEVVTMVSFESELLALPNAASNSNGELLWEANPDVTPKSGTAVKIRLTPVKENAKPEKPKDKKAE